MNINNRFFEHPILNSPYEDLRAGKAITRRYRNRRIGEFLKELDLTKGRSTGILKVLRVMAENGSPAPEFETDDDRTYFLIRLPIHAGVTPQVGTKLGLSRDQVMGEAYKLLSVLEKCPRLEWRRKQLLHLKERPIPETDIWAQP